MKISESFGHSSRSSFSRKYQNLLKSKPVLILVEGRLDIIFSISSSIKGSSVFFWLNSTQKVVCETHAIYMTSRAQKTIVGFQTNRNNWKNNRSVVVFIRWWNLFKKDVVFCFGIREISYFQHIVPCPMEKRDCTSLPLKDVHVGILKIGKGWKYG